ncbi:uncharacterized protein LOC132262156 [Phlebotomus argentipes]|uniref:uncharacterized protein LOC132262156 n=1 Tax=Phlebotomus argentipes TaxID=94469 RepID=UPI0028933D93|nr:uncharacterized protein LOC132262156 [Phlebotomus argentipes]
MTSGVIRTVASPSSEIRCDGVATLLVEHRPRLQSACVFIQLQESVKESVKLSVKPTEIILKLPEKTLRIVLDNFTLNTHSLTSMIAAGKHISFRINTNSEQFREEIISVNPSGGTQLTIPVHLKSGRSYGLLCSNCKAFLVARGSIYLRRVLELPSESADSSDWFCHKPSSSGNCDILTPKLDEIFYGNFFFTINRGSVANVRERNGLVYCQRCLQLLGRLLDESRVRVWNECVLFTTERHEEMNLMPNISQMTNFRTIIRKILLDFTMAGQCGLAHFQKIAFNCHLPEGSVCYLLLQIVDKKLDVYRSQSSPGSDCLQLGRGTAMKVMYQSGEEAQVPQIGQWLGDANVTQTEISCKMLQSALNSLAENAQILPQVYRSSCGFQVSYLFCD